MRLLITGSNGMLGQKLLATISGSNFDLYTCDLAATTMLPSIPQSYVSVDITNTTDIRTLILTIKPEIIIHTAAMTNVDLCEKERSRCWAVNVGATARIVKTAEKIGSKLIFISTDYIFDGTKKSYRETDPPNPLSYYGRSKLAAENVIRGSKMQWAIIRTIVLYGHGILPKASFVSWLLGVLQEGKTPNIVTDQISNMTFVDDLAIAIEKVIMQEYCGIIHIGGCEIMSRYEFACIFAELFGFDRTQINAILTKDLNQAAVRPLFSVLNIERAISELEYSPRTISEALLLYRQQVIATNTANQ